MCRLVYREQIFHCCSDRCFPRLLYGKQTRLPLCNQNRKRRCFPRSRSTGNGEKTGITVETAKGKRDLVFFWDMRRFKTAPLPSRSVIKLLLQPGVLLFTPFRSTAIRVSRLLAPAALLMLCLWQQCQQRCHRESCLFPFLFQVVLESFCMPSSRDTTFCYVYFCLECFLSQGFVAIKKACQAKRPP